MILIGNCMGRKKINVWISQNPFPPILFQGVKIILSYFWIFCSELYLDGNKLECEGLIELIKIVVDSAEQESIKRQEEKLTGNNGVEETGAMSFLGVKTGMSSVRSGSAVSVKSASSARWMINPFLEFKSIWRNYDQHFAPHKNGAKVINTGQCHIKLTFRSLPQVLNGVLILSTSWDSNTQNILEGEIFGTFLVYFYGTTGIQWAKSPTCMWLSSEIARRCRHLS